MDKNTWRINEKRVLVAKEEKKENSPKNSQKGLSCGQYAGHVWIVGAGRAKGSPLQAAPACELGCVHIGRRLTASLSGRVDEYARSARVWADLLFYLVSRVRWALLCTGTCRCMGCCLHAYLMNAGRLAHVHGLRTCKWLALAEGLSDREASMPFRVWPKVDFSSCLGSLSPWVTSWALSLFV